MEAAAGTHKLPTSRHWKGVCVANMRNIFVFLFLNVNNFDLFSPKVCNEILKHTHTHTHTRRLGALQAKAFCVQVCKAFAAYAGAHAKALGSRGLVSATAAANDISYAHLHCSESLLTRRERVSSKREREGERSIALAAGATDAPAVVVVAGFVFRRVLCSHSPWLCRVVVLAPAKPAVYSLRNVNECAARPNLNYNI